MILKLDLVRFTRIVKRKTSGRNLYRQSVSLETCLVGGAYRRMKYSGKTAGHQAADRFTANIVVSVSLNRTKNIVLNFYSRIIML